MYVALTMDVPVSSSSHLSMVADRTDNFKTAGTDGSLVGEPASMLVSILPLDYHRETG